MRITHTHMYVEEYHAPTLLYNEFWATSESISLSPFIAMARRSWAADRRANVCTVQTQ